MCVFFVMFFSLQFGARYLNVWTMERNLLENELIEKYSPSTEDNTATGNAAKDVTDLSVKTFSAKLEELSAIPTSSDREKLSQKLSFILQFLVDQDSTALFTTPVSGFHVFLYLYLTSLPFISLLHPNVSTIQ